MDELSIGKELGQFKLKLELAEGKIKIVKDYMDNVRAILERPAFKDIIEEDEDDD